MSIQTLFGITMNLIKRFPDRHTPFFQLHLNQWQSIHQNSHIVAIGMGSFLFKLRDHLHFIPNHILFIHQIDVLDMTIEEGYYFFENLPSIRRKLETLLQVGLGYVKIGQPSTELSGGEAQRVKLATELSRRATGQTVYILDEPTTGLHTEDIRKLIEVLNQLVEQGNTIIVIEHNLDVIKTADHVIDLGPEGGDGGGEIVAVGTPEEIAKVMKSYTGQFLKKIL